MLLSAAYLTSFLLISVSPWHTSCSNTGMDSVHPVSAYQTVAASEQVHRTTLVDSKASWDAILAQETSLAKSYFEKQAASQAPAGTELTPSFRSTQLAQTQATTPTAENSKIQALPVEDFATRKDFLEMADVKLDKSTQHWSATWEKPKMFNFGMLLKPALVQNMTPGASYSFVSQGKLTTITRTGDDQLLLQRGDEKFTLNASDLRNLLSDHISVNGLNVFLDRRGNLVMEARGPKALSMPTVSKM